MRLYVKWYRKQILIALALMLSASTQAERMDVGTHDLIIGKLTGALRELPKNSSERPSIMLRLADLLADRARLKMITKMDTKCDSCDDGKQDRIDALKTYNQVFAKLRVDRQGEVLLQMAHLQSTLGNSAQAIKTLRAATDSKKFDSEVLSRAHANLGEILFRKAEFKTAENHFKISLTYKNAPTPGFLTYRLAWSRLNQGKIKEATATLIHLLNTPELLTQQQGTQVEFDQSFHDDVTRDLVTFLARGNVSQKEIDLLLSLSPEKLRKENLYNLANELERLGKKYSATLAWAAYNEEGDPSPSDSLETQIRVAQLKWDMGRRDLALTEYQKATELWRKKGCEGDKCDELSRRLKNFVTTWNRVEKDSPSRSCFAAYQHYLKAFNQDPQMFYKAATVADQLKLPNEATLLYAETARLIVEQKGKVDQQLLEASLLKQIEAAELSKNKQAQLKAYDTYLELNANGSQVQLVRYQRAHVTMELGQFKSALEQFKDIVRDSRFTNLELKIKAADLSLDILSQSRDHQQIFDLSGQFAQILKSRRGEYLGHQGQAAIELAAAVLSSKKSSSSDLKQEQERLKNLDLKNASQKQKTIIFKNRIALSERMQDVSGVKSAASQLLSLKGLSRDDKEYALTQLVWAADLNLDFAEALRLTRTMTLPKLSPVDRHLRIALLQELAGQDPSKEYRAALRLTQNQKQAQGIRATLVRLSPKPWRTLREYKSELQKNPSLLSSLVIEIYAEQPDERQAKSILSSSKLGASPLLELFRQRDFLVTWKGLDRKISQHALIARSEVLMQNSLRRRLDLLNQLDELGQNAVRNQDGLGQMLVLNSMARENNRLFTEIKKLPIPRGLKGADRDKYQALLNSKAAEFQKRATTAEQTLADFWQKDKIIPALAQAHSESTGAVRTLIKGQLLALAKISSAGNRRQIEKIVNQAQERPTARDLAQARRRVQKRPFNLSELMDLKRIAEQRGEATMVVYLDGRITKLRKEVNQ